MNGDIDPVSLLYAGTMVGTVLLIIGLQAVLPRLLERAPESSAPEIFTSRTDVGSAAGAPDPLPSRLSLHIAGDASVPGAEQWSRRHRRPR